MKIIIHTENVFVMNKNTGVQLYKTAKANLALRSKDKYKKYQMS